jgi:1-acyl-sn-glycerol-3-phosphate acyltransferase
MRRFVMLIIKAFSMLFFYNDDKVSVYDYREIKQKHIKYIDLDKYSSGIIVATTHTSYLDGLFCNLSMPRKGYCLAKIELFDNKIKGFFYKNILGFIPINRDKPKLSELKNAINILKRGDILYVAPSGTRTDNIEHIKRGIVSMALIANVPILIADIGGIKKFHFKYIKHRPIVNYNFGVSIDVSILVNELIEKNFTLKEAKNEATKIVEQELKAIEKESQYQKDCFSPNIIKSSLNIFKDLCTVFKEGGFN